MSVKYPVIPLPGPEGFFVKYIYIKSPYLLPPSCFSILQLRIQILDIQPVGSTSVMCECGSVRDP